MEHMEPEMEDRPEQMSPGGQMLKARKLVQGQFYYDVDANRFLPLDDIYVVWFSKTLQNWKALVSTNVKDNMYYEVTYNGNKKEAYIDAYMKVTNIVISD